MMPVDLYLSVRAAEERLFPDELVSRLPSLPAHHPLSSEWRARSASQRKLVRYLSRRSATFSILELGCGNGWLSACLARLPAARVYGLDINRPELAQASRIFSRRNLLFLYAHISAAPFSLHSFEIIILASVIQYFPDLPALLRSLLPLLKPGGELHLLDSPLYLPAELPAARQRTSAYYARLGFPAMADHYYFHTAAELAEFNPHWLYHPRDFSSRLARRLGGATSPFPWICLRP